VERKVFIYRCKYPAPSSTGFLVYLPCFSE
jgi:hypothetical protein